MTRGLADFNAAALLAFRTSYRDNDGVRSPLTAERLAVMAGTTKAQILAYENGHRVPDPVRIRALADALNVPPRALMRLDRAADWTVADLRRGGGLRAQDVVKRLGISVKSYRRFEQQGIVPGRHPRFLDDVAACLATRVPGLERAIDNIPAVLRRRQRATELTTLLAERYVTQAGAWNGPDVDDPALLELAVLYGRSPQRIRRVMTHQLAELRQIMTRIRREQATVDYDPGAARQEKARGARRRWTALYAQELASIPVELEQFHRSAQRSDTWQVLVDLHDADTHPEGPWVPSALLGPASTLDVLPPSMVSQGMFNDVPAAQLTMRGQSHIRKFRGLYAALYPTARRPRVRTVPRGTGATRPTSGRPDLNLQLAGRSERFTVPPSALARILQASDRKDALEVRLSPTVVLHLEPTRPSATVGQEDAPGAADHDQ
ncbi:helix-turn-helix domain-containing protein [Streptomyces noursei]|uniref:helix-turn-helix domain-containing protein n=1 Tax=Streptomyces noursei TaxID=1971 RepID=UPI00382DF78F